MEYEESGLDIEQLKKLISEKKIMYNHSADKKDVNKWSNTRNLEKISISQLPSYIENNITKFGDWID